MPKDDTPAKMPKPGGVPDFASLPLPSVKAAQHIVRLQLELTAFASRRARAWLEAPRTYAQCRSMDDVVAANTAFMAAFWDDHLAAQQRMLAAILGLPGGQMPAVAAAPVAAVESPAVAPPPAPVPQTSEPVTAKPNGRAPDIVKRQAASPAKRAKPVKSKAKPRVTAAKKTARKPAARGRKSQRA